MRDRYKLLIVLGIFVLAYFMPFKSALVQKAVLEAFYMLQDYAQKHVLLCLVPAFFIAGAITVFMSQTSVMKYLGPLANKFLAYSVASVSGTILAVCSCTVLPLFAGIYRMGAGIGPATAFLYSGPAINILAIVLSAKVLGWRMRLARATGGTLMHFATLTEVPIVQGLIGSGMGKGPALALLLAGPALSLPSMIVIRSILGTKKAFVFFGLVIGLYNMVGVIFGRIAG